MYIMSHISKNNAHHVSLYFNSIVAINHLACRKAHADEKTVIKSNTEEDSRL